MGEAHGNGIRRVSWRCDREAKKRADHEGDLRFLRGACAHDGLLNATRRVFVDGQSALGSGEQNGSTGGSQSDRCGETLHIDHTLDGHGCRIESRYGIREPRVNFQEAACNSELRRVFYYIEMQAAHLAGSALEHGEAGSAERGIHGEQDFIGIH
jgi:hypothetical protein